MRAKRSRGPWLWPLLLTVIGVALLLNNFLLLGDFNVVSLLPLVLVTVGLVILLRGDLVPGSEGWTFAITRGSVESGTLEISAGEVDIQLRALQQEGRLIAGQFAQGARPTLQSTDNHAHLILDRAQTPWYSLANWEMSIARDLPWQVYVSTHLGQVNINLAEVIIQDALIATGLGDIRLVAPAEALGPLVVCSALGDIHVVTPVGHPTRIQVEGGRLVRVHTDANRYEAIGPSLYAALDAQVNTPPVEITIRGTLSSVYLT